MGQIVQQIVTCFDECLAMAVPWEENHHVESRRQGLCDALPEGFVAYACLFIGFESVEGMIDSVWDVRGIRVGVLHSHKEAMDLLVRCTQ